MAGKEKRRAALRHLTRELVRENFALGELFLALAEAREEEAKRIEVNPQAKDEVHTLEREALLLRQIAHERRAELG